jgi:KDO2-lipid IV(A) lauroyltransferase
VASPKRRAFRDAALFRALVFCSFVAQRVPLGVGRALGRGLGTVANLLLRRQRGKAFVHLGIAFPELSFDGRRKRIREMFRHLGETLFEILWLPNLSKETLARTTEIAGLDLVREALAGDRGVVLFTGHCGNWEWMAAALAVHGIHVTVIARERDDARLNDFMVSLREQLGIKTIERGSVTAAKQMLQTLRGGILGALIDQNIRAESAQVPFFGRPALTPIGPAKLAIRAGSTIIGCFNHRIAGRHHIHFEPPIVTSRGDDPVEVTARMTAQIEAQIRRAPEPSGTSRRGWGSAARCSSKCVAVRCTAREGAPHRVAPGSAGVTPNTTQPAAAKAAATTDRPRWRMWRPPSRPPFRVGIRSNPGRARLPVCGAPSRVVALPHSTAALNAPRESGA